jgi:acyl-CoA thioesterase-1
MMLSRRLHNPLCGYESQRWQIIASVLTVFVLTWSIVLRYPQADQEPLRLLIVGDSLTAGYGLAEKDAFPVRLETALSELGYHVRVEASSVSGDTSAGGRARLNWALGATPDDYPDAVMIQLGANDALRGFNPGTTSQNLSTILTELQSRGIQVLLAGMRAPPNMGRDYTERFDAIFPRLAEQHDVMLYPFFLDGVAAQPALNQADGMHPNAAGVDEIVRRITPTVIELLETVGKESASL